jgi:SAM-dependent methyltransferase
MLSLSRLLGRKKMVFECRGRCPVCQSDTTFRSKSEWLRDGLLCARCRSIPRERAFAWALDTFCPDWRSGVVHECSPADRLVSNRMRRECAGYVGSQFFADLPAGQVRNGFRSENLERLSFDDRSIDVHCHLDVLEHVNDPAACFAEMARTLRPGGRMIFTTPVYEGKATTERRAEYLPEGIRHIAEPEYHGNPISEDGALVTFHYGADLADLILSWAPGCSVILLALNDPALGILGKFREVFVVTRNQ